MAKLTSQDVKHKDRLLSNSLLQLTWSKVNGNPKIPDNFQDMRNR